jgi:hypothetical protein
MSVNTMDLSAKFLPQLPGYRPKTMSTSVSRPQIFSRRNGETFVKDTNAASVAEFSTCCEDSSVLSIGAVSRPGTAQSVNGAANTDKILTFQAFYDDEANGAGPTVRQSVYLYFFVDDSSIKVVIAPKKRGGDRSGTKLRRCVVMKENDELYCPEDFRLGSTVTIYGRSYYIVDCDQTTREFMSDGFTNHTEPEEEPVDYSSLLAEEDNVSYDHEWAAFRPKKGELKIYMEAKMGNTTNNKKREGFIAYGNSVLKFLCYWDDTKSMYGKRHEYAIIYHLADDTVDITAVQRNSDGGECKQLLKRAKLPKSGGGQRTNGEFLPNPGKDGVYHWSDFYVGAAIEVYTRTFVIIDADLITRQFFADNGLELAAPERVEAAPVKAYVRAIPPHVGFGSEEDSLRSCTGSVASGAPRQKKFNPDAAVLVFLSNIVSSDPSDTQRKFVVSFYVDDNTIKILEPPQRNSGFAGGMFLSRQKMKAPDGTFFTEAHFDVGNTITVACHNFVLTGADTGTQRYLELRHAANNAA